VVPDEEISDDEKSTPVQVTRKKEKNKPSLSQTSIKVFY